MDRNTSSLIGLSSSAATGKSPVNTNDGQGNSTESEYLAKLDETIGMLSGLGPLKNIDVRIFQNQISAKSYPKVHLITLTGLLLKRYQRTHVLQDVQMAISYGDLALKSEDNSDFRLEYLYRDLARLHAILYKLSDEAEYVPNVIRYVLLATDMPSSEPSFRFDLLSDLSSLLISRFTKNKNPTDLDNAVKFANLSRKHIPQDPLLGPPRLKDHSALLRSIYNLGNDISMLEGSIVDIKEAICRTAADDEELPFMLKELSERLETRFQTPIGTPQDIEDAIIICYEAERLVSENHRFCALLLTQLARQLYRRYQITQRDQEYRDAIATGEKALSLSADDPDILQSLITIFPLPWGNGADLEPDRNITILMWYRKALLTVKSDTTQKRPIDDENISYLDVLERLGSLLILRASSSEGSVDIETAISIGKEAMELMPNDYPRKYHVMINLASALYQKATDIGQQFPSDSSKDLNEAIKFARGAVLEGPSDDPSRAYWLYTYGSILFKLFECDKDPENLNAAIELGATAVSLVTENTPPEILVYYGFWLLKRFEWDDIISDLNAAIEINLKAIDMMSEANQNILFCQNNLAQCLSKRFERKGDRRDLVQAIILQKAVINSTPDDVLQKAILLSNLSHNYLLKYERDRVSEDLINSIDIIIDVLAKIPQDHPQRPFILCNAAGALREKAFIGQNGHEDQKNAINTSIQLFDEGLRNMPEDTKALHFKAALGVTFRRRAVLLGFNDNYTKDIDRSIEVLNEARSFLQAEDKIKSSIGFELGISLWYRYNVGGDPDPLRECASVFTETFRLPGSGPLIRIISARNAAYALDLLSRPHEASSILKEAVELLPTIIPRYLPRSDQQFLISRAYGIATMAATMAIKSGRDRNEAYSILEVLERGRGIIASILMEPRIDVTMLDSDLASEYSQARSSLEATLLAENSHRDAGSERVNRFHYITESQSRHEAEQALRKTIEKIQADPKTERFLQLPAKDELLKALGNDTIVVINANEYRCDAFVISQRHGVEMLELTKLKNEEILRRVEQLRISRPLIDPSLLEWLWDTIGSPILEKLGFTQGGPVEKLPHIIWILTGFLSRLPIHAAGRDSAKSTESVLHRVISSYSSSLRSYFFGKTSQCGFLTSESTSRRKFYDGKDSETYLNKALLVGMSKTPGTNFELLQDLPFVEKEIERVEKLCAKLSLDPVRPSIRTRDNILKELTDASIFHFAGHGKSDPLDPSHSGLHLENGLLTVDDIQARIHKLGSDAPFLSYLSACLTGTNDKDDLVDEGVHLINTFQLLGSRHVVGTLWQIDDNFGAEVAESVYRHLAEIESEITDRAVSVALHLTLLNRRNAWVAERDKLKSSGFRDTSKTSTEDYELISTHTEESQPSNPTKKADEPLEIWKLDRSLTMESILEQDIWERDCTARPNRWSPRLYVKADWVPYVHYGP
ncbi:hypothetical protein AA313_de0200850 [Arthrobotrys entomopaga]|nr:hypothetical protein AA313_de0200850 [Arthrobotrys entomopaga]